MGPFVHQTCPFLYTVTRWLPSKRYQVAIDDFIDSMLKSDQSLIEESDIGVINDIDEQLIKGCSKSVVNRLKVAQNVKTTETEPL